MNSSDLIKQRRNRIVYNSYVGQTKPQNKITQTSFEILRQRRLGPHQVYDGNVVALPACDCSLPEPNVTALSFVLFGFFAGTSTGNVYITEGEGEEVFTWTFITNVGAPVLSIDFTFGEGGQIRLYIVTSTQVWGIGGGFYLSNVYNTTYPVTITGSTSDLTTTNLYLATTSGAVYLDGSGNASNVFSGNLSAIASDGSNVYVARGSNVYYAGVDNISGGFSDTGFDAISGDSILFLGVSPSGEFFGESNAMYVATRTNVYYTNTPRDASDAIALDPPISGSISCMNTLIELGAPLAIGSTSGNVYVYEDDEWFTYTQALGGNVNTLAWFGGAFAGTPQGAFANYSENLSLTDPWIPLPFNT